MRDARHETHINELERIPNFEERNRGELEPGDWRKAKDVCAKVEQLVDDVGDEPERAGGCGGDALRNEPWSVTRCAYMDDDKRGAGQRDAPQPETRRSECRAHE